MNLRDAPRFCLCSPASHNLSPCLKLAQPRVCACYPTSTATITDVFVSFLRVRRQAHHRLSSAQPNTSTPLPSQLPRIIWRGGLDLNPLDLSNPLEVKWLESLVWPGQEGRLERLAAAIKIARRHQLDLRRGDLLADMPALLKGAPRDATRTRDMRVADGCD